MLYKTSAGTLQLTIHDQKIISAIFIDHQKVLSANVETLPLAFNGTPFQIKVWKAAMQIPAGHTKTYQQLAEEIGHPKAHRAVANALGANKIAYFIPCHRVIRTDGRLGGYKWGIERKRALLKAEGIKKIVDQKL